MRGHHVYQAEEGADTGGGAPPPPPADGPPSGLPTAEEWASTQALIAELKADRDASAAGAAAAAEAAEAERVAALSVVERQAEEQAALKATLDAQSAELRRDRRDLALDKLGVLPHFRGYVPDVDPKTAEGAAQLEEWAKAHPEAVKAAAPSAAAYAPPPKSALHKILSGEAKHPFITADSVRKTIGSN